jgi:hypothetical protein
MDFALGYYALDFPEGKCRVRKLASLATIVATASLRQTVHSRV